MLLFEETKTAAFSYLIPPVLLCFSSPFTPCYHLFKLFEEDFMRKFEEKRDEGFSMQLLRWKSLNKPQRAMNALLSCCLVNLKRNRKMSSLPQKGQKDAYYKRGLLGLSC